MQESPADSSTIRSFKRYLKTEQGKEFWSDAEIAMGKHLGAYSDRNADQYGECIEDFEERMAEYLEAEQAR